MRGNIMKLVKTQNSSYVVDEANKQVCRLEGIAKPTFRIGQDGQWRKYEAIEFEVGKSMLICWEVGVGDDGAHAEVLGIGLDDENSPRLRITRSSKIVSVEEMPTT
jgi:hypothetical protein